MPPPPNEFRDVLDAIHDLIPRHSFNNTSSLCFLLLSVAIQMKIIAEI